MSYLRDTSNVLTVRHFRLTSYYKLELNIIVDLPVMLFSQISNGFIGHATNNKYNNGAFQQDAYCLPVDRVCVGFCLPRRHIALKRQTPLWIDKYL